MPRCLIGQTTIEWKGNKSLSKLPAAPHKYLLEKYTPLIMQFFIWKDEKMKEERSMDVLYKDTLLKSLKWLGRFVDLKQPAR